MSTQILPGYIDMSNNLNSWGIRIPGNQQIDRVNFITNVTSGGNLLNNRHNFDQFVGNITIGKIPRP